MDSIYSREDKHMDKNDCPQNLCQTKQGVSCLFFLLLKVFDNRGKKQTVEWGNLQWEKYVYERIPLKLRLNFAFYL